MPADRAGKPLPEPTKRGLLRAVKVDDERMCFVHDWTRDSSLSYLLRYGGTGFGPDGREINRRTLDLCAATALDLLQDLVMWPAKKREEFVRAIRKEMERER